MIVDSQIHIWGADTPERAWPPSGGPGRTAKPQRDIPWSATEVIAEMDRAGVAGALLVPPSWEGERNDLCLAAALHHPDRFAVMGRLDPDDPRNRSRIAGWRSQGGMLGIRLLIREGARWLEQGASHWLWEEAEAAGVPLTLAMRQSYPLVEEIAGRYPGLLLSIDHLGCPHNAKGDAAFAHLPRLLQLARFPNIAVKASCMPAYSSDPYPFTSLHEPLRRVFDAFGPRRMFWGSDLSRLPCPYREAVSLFTQELPWLRGDDLAWVLGRAAREWFGWHRTPVSSG